jgi:membrane protein YdbS with pleckstrin-like domain
MSSLEQLVARVFRTPPEPDSPTGASNSLRVFRASRSYFHYQLLVWGVRQIGAITAIVLLLWFDAAYGIHNFAPGVPNFVMWGLRVLETLAIVGLAIQIPLTYVLTRLDYHYRWYMTTDRSLRIREGIVNVREQTMMFSNVQNVAIRQGPLQRAFGISDVEVRSAGGGGASEKSDRGASRKDDLHLGYFRGVSNPEEIRDLILEHLRRLKDRGLGDPDEPASGDRSVGAMAAARLLLAEAKQLRDSLT